MYLPGFRYRYSVFDFRRWDIQVHCTFQKQKVFRYFVHQIRESSCRRNQKKKSRTNLFVFAMTSHFQTRFSISALRLPMAVLLPATVRRLPTYVPTTLKEKWWSTKMRIMISDDLVEGRIGRTDRGTADFYVTRATWNSGKTSRTGSVAKCLARKTQ